MPFALPPRYVALQFTAFLTTPPPPINPSTSSLISHSCMHKEIFKGRYEWSHPLPVLLPAHSWSVSGFNPKRNAHVHCCSPSPAYTAIMHTHTARLKWAETKEIRCCWQPQSHHLRKRHWSCLYDVRGGLLSSDEDRSMERTGCSFWIKQTKHFLGFLHYYPSIPLSLQSNRTIWTLVLVCNISWLQIIE